MSDKTKSTLILDNIITSLWIHLLMGILSLVIFRIFYDASISDWVTKEAETKHYMWQAIPSAILLIGYLVIFYFSGKAFLKMIDPIWNKISVALPLFISTVLWVLWFCSETSNIIMNNILEQSFLLFNGYQLSLMLALNRIIPQSESLWLKCIGLLISMMPFLVWQLAFFQKNTLVVVSRESETKSEIN